MVVKSLLVGTVLTLALAASATAQVAPGQPPLPPTAPPPVLPNANQTPMPSPDGTMPNANQTPEGSANTTLPRADGTIAPGVPSTSPACRPTSMTTNCNPPPNPSCVPGQTPPAGTTCPTSPVP